MTLFWCSVFIIDFEQVNNCKQTIFIIIISFWNLCQLFLEKLTDSNE